MLKQTFPKVHHYYASLPILGSILDGFAKFLVENGYPRRPLRLHLRATRKIDRKLSEHGLRSIKAITRADLRACVPSPSLSYNDIRVASTVRLLERFLAERKMLPAKGPPSLMEKKLDQYRTYLQQVRGFSPGTVNNHQATVLQFIDHLGNDHAISLLSKLKPVDIESYVRVTGCRVGRGRLQHIVAHLRSFLRFLATHGETTPGLDTQIDTPRLYRGEQLPRALPWETVRTLLRSIDRSTSNGLRDYAMLLLIATYGLRSCEVVELRLDDIEWRNGRLRVPQRKTASPLVLPLTDIVGESLVEYLRHGRPKVPCREIFVRHKAPAGLLKPTAVTEVFQACSRRSGLQIPFQGPHCLRHSYAVHLLRQGTSLKTIGDILGHRSTESTCVYLRLAVEDLRDVALCIPLSNIQEVQS